jgi:hypothetical protein
MDSSVKKENYDLVLYRLEQIERKLDVMSRNYVTKEEFDEFKQDMHRELKRKSFFNAINPIIASISTAIITFLVIEFLKSR